jgi:ubiquinone/menaquinone biosynthesis C-methylase UbiE
MDEEIESTVDTYESVAEQYHERHADRSVIQGFLDLFLAILDGNRVLDIGCGPGWETETLADRGFDTTGIDLTPAFLDIATDIAPTGTFARMDMRHLGFSDQEFNGLWSCASFLHVPRSDAHSTLSEFHRVLRPGGTLALAVKKGTGEQTGNGYENDERRFTLYTVDDLHERVTKAGFKVKNMNSVTDDDGWIQCIASA